MDELKAIYECLLRPVFGGEFRIDDSGEPQNWVAVTLDGGRGDFYVSLYGTGCAHLYWCNQCFLFDQHRNDLVSSDTYGEIVYEAGFGPEELPRLIAGLVMQLKDCVYLSKKETVTGTIPSGYDDIKEYAIRLKAKDAGRPVYRLANITLEFV